MKFLCVIIVTFYVRSILKSSGPIGQQNPTRKIKLRPRPWRIFTSLVPQRWILPKCRKYNLSIFGYLKLYRQDSHCFQIWLSLKFILIELLDESTWKRIFSIESECAHSYSLCILQSNFNPSIWYLN